MTEIAGVRKEDEAAAVSDVKFAADCRTAYPTYGHSRPKIICTTCGVWCCNGCLASGSNTCIPCKTKADTICCEANDTGPEHNTGCANREKLDKTHPDYHFHGKYPDMGSGPCWDPRCIKEVAHE